MYKTVSSGVTPDAVHVQAADTASPADYFDDRYDERLEADKQAFIDRVRDFTSSDTSEHEDDNGNESGEYRKERTRLLTSEIGGRSVEILLWILVTAIYAVSVLEITDMVRAFVAVDPVEAAPSLSLIFLLVVGIAGFFVSTAYTVWNYDISKYIYLIALVTLTAVIGTQIIYVLIDSLLLPLLMLLTPNPWTTADKLMFMYRYVTIYPTVAIAFAITRGLCRVTFDKMALAKIWDLRILDYLDLRKNKRNLYDARIVRRRSTGRYYSIYEKARMEHSLVNGASGTAKTSSVFQPMIYGDMKHKVRNEDVLKKQIHKMLTEGQLYMTDRTSDEAFTTNCFAPVDANAAAKFEALLSKHRTCGMTIICPDESLTDKVYELCKTYSLHCNRVDPTVAPGTNGDAKEGFVAFNPLYLSPETPSWARSREIIKNAALFADVLQAIQDMKGKNDPYFSSLNRSVTVGFAICLSATFPYINHRQPTPDDVRDMVNKFSRIKPYYDKLVEINRRENNTYGFVCDFIENDILGKDADKMNDQARGLRNSMNEFLTDPLFNRVLCPKDGEPVLDMDKMLSEGQITVINFGKTLGGGDANSRGFGMFCLLSFLDAVYRRPGDENTRIPHFLYIDEFPEIVHPRIESALAQFRKFRCGIIIALQSMRQMEKNDTTRYLKDVLMEACAHHFLFGRCSTSEMREYAELAGKRYRLEETRTISESALSLEDTHQAMSTRISEKEEDVVSPTALRNRKFQEVTVFTVRNGNLVSPFVGKVNFLPKSASLKKMRRKYDWDKLYSLYGKSFIMPSSETVENVANSVPSSDNNMHVFETGGQMSDNGENGTEENTAGVQDSVNGTEDDEFIYVDETR